MKIKLSLSNLVTKAARVVVRDYQQEVTPLGITPSQAGVVYILSIMGGSTQVEIAKALHLEKTNINAMVKKLLTAGHLELQKDMFDARKSRVVLTPKGTELARKLVNVDKRVGQKYLNLAENESDAKAIRTFLEKIVFGDNLK